MLLHPLSQTEEIGLEIITTAKISNESSRESPYTSNTFSHESPNFHTRFHVCKRSPRHSNDASGKLIALEIQIFEVRSLRERIHPLSSIIFNSHSSFIHHWVMLWKTDRSWDANIWSLISSVCGILVRPCLVLGWPRLVGSIKLQVSFADYSLFYWSLLQKRPII